jgi:hypothetical protein
VAPTELAAASFRWTYLDAGWAQYNTSKGDLRAFLAAEAAAARQEGLGVVAGLNLLSGSGTNTASMTAAQLLEFGSALAADPAVCAFVAWRHDSAYLSRAGVREATDAVAAVARGRNAASCVVS